MAAEKNIFDDYLKDKLLRDLLFRGAIVVLLSLVASYYAIYIDAVEPPKFMLRVAESVMRGLNSVGIAALLLACSALMFKDLEVCDGGNWGQQTKKGYFGCCIRRLANDLTLWILGLVLTFFISTLISVALSKASLSISQIFVLTRILITILTWLVFVALLNILVRQNQVKRLLPKLKTPPQIIFAYSISIFTCCIAVLVL